MGTPLPDEEPWWTLSDLLSVVETLDFEFLSRVSKSMSLGSVNRMMEFIGLKATSYIYTILTLYMCIFIQLIFQAN